MIVYPQLLLAPAHDSEEFTQFLINNNQVVLRTKYWLVIENCKYHELESPHYTIFPINHCAEWNELSAKETTSLKRILSQYGDWFKYQNVRDQRTVQRLHLHVVRNYYHWLDIMIMNREKYEQAISPAT